MVWGGRYPEFHGRARADGLAADPDGEPQLDAAPHDDRADPQGPRVQQRRLHRAAELHELANVFYGTATNGGTLACQKPAPTRAAADKLVDERLAAPFTADANDFI